MRRLWLLLCVGLVATAGFLGVIAGRPERLQSIALPTAAVAPSVERLSTGPMPRDVDGDGRLSGRGVEAMPEYVASYGEGGVRGYIRWDDRVALRPSGPEDALELAQRGGSYIPLYADDTTTVIGQVFISFGFGSMGPEVLTPEG